MPRAVCLQYLRAIAAQLEPHGPKAMFYLAAAVSDFYIPWPELVSRAGWARARVGAWVRAGSFSRFFSPGENCSMFMCAASIPWSVLTVVRMNVCAWLRAWVHGCARCSTTAVVCHRGPFTLTGRAQNPELRRAPGAEASKGTFGVRVVDECRNRFGRGRALGVPVVTCCLQPVGPATSAT